MAGKYPVWFCFCLQMYVQTERERMTEGETGQTEIIRVRKKTGRHRHSGKRRKPPEVTDLSKQKLLK